MKLRLIFLLFLIIFLFFSKKIYAVFNFNVVVNAEYFIEENGKTKVTNSFSIRNNTSDFYTKSYLLKIEGFIPKNLKAFENGKELSTFYEKKEDLISIRIEFPEPVVGKGKERNFIVTYEQDSFATKIGEVWEINLPKLTDSKVYDQFNVTLSIPKSFGEEAYILPEPRESEQKEGRKIYKFRKEDIEKTGITANFGKFQVFSFTINYHLENSSNKQRVEKIALPPDTSTQEVYYYNIDPIPSKVSVDEDGNWIASYKLSSRQKILVKLSGSVSIFAKPRRFLEPSPSTLLENIKPTDYWQSDDPIITNIAKSFSSPKDIYNYITTNLNYNYDRVKPNAERLGAVRAILSPKDAICMEFTDLFIALARAKGIPAREINGYAYSENPKIQPLSLVADVLHSWPEYWDNESATWIPIDPTWGATSGGDFFSKLDLRHFAFVIHGKNPLEPISPGSYKLGSNPQKDVFVSIGENKPKIQRKLDIDIKYPKHFELFKKTAKIVVVNSGGSALYNSTVQVIFDEESVYSEYFPVIPPFASLEKEIKIPIGIFGTKAPKSAKILAYRAEKSLPTHKTQLVIYQLLLLTLILCSILIYLSYKMGRVEFLNKFYEKFRNKKNQ